MQGPGLRLVGRANEMAALEDEFTRAAAGEFRVVLLYGEAGVGKGRLGRELLAHHPEAAGMFARAHPLGVTAAFGLWAEAIDPLLAGRSDREVTATGGGDRARGGEGVPADGGPEPAGRRGHAAGPQRTGRSAVRAGQVGESGVQGHHPG